MELEEILDHLERQLVLLTRNKNQFLNIPDLPEAQVEALVAGLSKIAPQILQNEISEKPATVLKMASQVAHVPNDPLPQSSSPLPNEVLLARIQGMKDRLSNQTTPSKTTSSVRIESPSKPSTPVSAVNTLAPPPPHQCYSLDELENHYHLCQRCVLGATRTNFVFGAGHLTPSLMFIGEGPGDQEDRLGQPFVGKAGKLLDRMIQVLGIDRPDVYIANVVKCRPPQNRTPEPNEIAECLPLLKRQIELINPRLIVTLGNVPTKALIPNAPGITSARGRIFKYQQWTLLPTFHPSYLLRTPSAMELVWADFKQIKSLAFA
ncbi:uracil-DNA glycosylase [Deltaproteobacteria bacterium TL4]